MDSLLVLHCQGDRSFRHSPTFVVTLFMVRFPGGEALIGLAEVCPLPGETESGTA